MIYDATDTVMTSLVSLDIELEDVFVSVEAAVRVSGL